MKNQIILNTIKSCEYEKKLSNASKKKIHNHIRDNVDYNKEFNPQPLYNMLEATHNNGVFISKESRTFQLAYGYLRGREFREMENFPRSRPDFDAIEEIVIEHSIEDEVRVKQQFAEWYFEAVYHIDKCNNERDEKREAKLKDKQEVPQANWFKRTFLGAS